MLTFAYQLHAAGAAGADRLESPSRGLALPDLVVIGLLNAIIAGIAVLAVRALDLRFGEPERLAW